MKIDQLPLEMLMEIFRYLPMYDKVSLVNKRFYSIVCKLKDPLICIRISSQMNTEWLQSMQTSNREITNVEIGPIGSSLNEEQILSVVERFSATIKTVILIRTLTESLFLRILSLIPNVEHLELLYFPEYNVIENQSIQRRGFNLKSLARRLLYWKQSVIDDRPSQMQHCCEDLNLKKLKSLTIFCWRDIYKVFARLPVGVLRKLRVGGFHWNKIGFLSIEHQGIKVGLH